VTIRASLADPPYRRTSVVADRLAKVRRADQKMRAAQQKYLQVAEDRRSAMVEAYATGATINEIAAACNVKHELVRRTVREAGL
jgi:DNA-directed RNA polymerase specialized sigma24 family protein